MLIQWWSKLWLRSQQCCCQCLLFGSSVWDSPHHLTDQYFKHAPITPAQLYLSLNPTEPSGSLDQMYKPTIERPAGK